MREDFLAQKLREAVQRRSLKPPDEHWRELIEAGIIDEQGQVLKRAPEPPEDSNNNGDTSAAAPAPFREALSEWNQKPPEEQFRDLVEAGIIDQQGHVLKREPASVNDGRKNGDASALIPS